VEEVDERAVRHVAQEETAIETAQEVQTVAEAFQRLERLDLFIKAMCGPTFTLTPLEIVHSCHLSFILNSS
jgi:hypothetical protein